MPEPNHVMRVLVVNAGSSTLKLRLLDGDDQLVVDETIDPWKVGDTDAVAPFVEDAGTIDAVGHRVVHGGEDLREATPIDAAVEDRIDALTALAPLHQPGAVAGIRVLRRLLPDTPSVACFDTAFHATLGPAVATYALPGEWRDRWPVRRFGFHGLSHAYVARRAPDVAGRPAAGLRLVSCHLGAGASLCAVADGRSVDTTMGFTPLEGLVMATRSGSVDPGLVLWLVTEAGLAATEVGRRLEQESGLAGLAGGSGDMRELLERRGAGDDAARLAFDVYVHRLARETAAMVAALGGLDVLAFTGGIGQHSPEVRTAVADRLDFLGIALDPDGNAAAARDGDADISASHATAAAVVIEAREDLEIARQTRAALGT
jgi:acetate kinase